jgi:hypothetical protein
MDNKTKVFYLAFFFLEKQISRHKKKNMSIVIVMSKAVTEEKVEISLSGILAPASLAICPSVRHSVTLKFNFLLCQM